MEQTFLVLKDHYSGSNNRNDAANPAHLVLFAEKAAKSGFPDLSLESLNLYFGLSPPTNQFLIRAHLCKSLAITANNSVVAEERLQKAVESITTAVDIARKSECYHFLVHNASVLLWQICRPYRGRPGWMGLCVGGWQGVARAQETIKEEDHAWRLDILLGLMESQVDAGLKEEAGKTCHSALQLARKKVPGRLQEVLKLSVFHGQGVGRGVEKETKSLPESSLISRLYTLKQQTMSQNTLKHSEIESELRKLAEIATSKPPSSKKKTTTHSSTVSPKFSSPVSKAAIQLEIAQLCVEQDLIELSGECVAALPTEEVLGSRLELLKQAVRAQIDLRIRAAGLPLYSRISVEIRQEIISRLENCLISSQRLGHYDIVENVSVVLWEICLPLLQPNLRSRLSNALSTLSSALSDIESVNYRLRCVVHMELAKVLADKDQLKTALEHINKAHQLDRDSEWSEQLRILEQRLQLTSELYHIPSSPLLQATQLIEQVKSSRGCGSQKEMRAVLVKIGELLAPNHFRPAITGRTSSPQDQSVSDTNTVEIEEEEEGRERGGEGRSLGGDDDSEYEGVLEQGVREEMTDETVDKDTRNTTYEKAYEQYVKEQIEAHRKEVDITDDSDRCRLWAKLAKFAHRCEVWDVAFISSKFCLIYDDNRWTAPQLSTTSDHQSKSTTSRAKLQKSSSSLSVSRSDVLTRSSMLSLATEPSGPVSEREAGRRRGSEILTRELIRTLAETHFVHAECAVYQLKQGGHQLGDGVPPTIPPPQLPVDEGSELNNTVQPWPGSLSSEAYSSFLRAGELGCSLQEPWLVTNAATYICNYSSHLMESEGISQLIPVFRSLLASLTTARQHQIPGHHTIEEELVCRVGTVLAGGLVQKWTPTPHKVEPPKEKPGSRKSGRNTGKKRGGGDNQLQVSPDSGPELKEALTVCENAVKSSENLSLAVRAPLLAMWVRCKQLLREPIPSKTLGVDDMGGESSVGMCRAVVAVEMVSLKENRIWDFSDCPSLNDVLELVRSCTWSGEDLSLKLKLLAHIARLALLNNNYSLVRLCAEEALVKTSSDDKPVTTDRKKLGKKERRGEREKNSHQEKLLLSTITSLQGQAIVADGVGTLSSHRAALDSFLQSARYGREAGSCRLTMDAGRHSWNIMCRRLTKTPLDRESLHGSLTELLSILTSFLPRRHSSTSSPGQVVVEEDLQLLVAMYNTLFQIYVDREEWTDGMKAVEEALWIIPRTVHQDFAEYKMVFRSRMGNDVTADMIRLQDIPDEERAWLWYKAACNSSIPYLQLNGFQNSITALTSQSHVLMKVDILISLSEWLYQHQYPVEDALRHLKWALSLLLTPREGKEKEEKEEEEKEEVVEKDEEEGKRSEPSVSTREKVVQILVMMARLQGRENTSHKETCLAALAHCYLIWKDTLESFSQTLSEKNSVTIPSSIQGWIDFTLTDELKEFVKSGDSDYSINPRNIKFPGLTSHYLGMLSDELCARDLHGLAIPVETFRLLVVECLLQSRATSQLIHLRLGSMCGALGAEKVREEHRVLSGPVYLNHEDMARSRVEMKHLQQKQESVKKSKQANEQSEICSIPPHQTMEILGVILRKVWVEEATILIEQGQCDVARELLHEAQESSEVFRDGETMGRVLLARASLAAAEKRVSDCIHCVCKALEGYPLGLEEWRRGIEILLQIAVSEKSHSLRKNISNTVSETLNCLISSVGKRNEKKKMDVMEVFIRARLVSLKVLTVLDTSQDILDHDIEQLYQEMSASVSDLVKLGRNEEAAEIMLCHAEVLMRRSSTDSQRSGLLEAMKLGKRAVDTLQSVLRETLSLSPLSEGLFVRVETLLVEAGLKLANILLCVSEKYVEEEKQELNKQKLKTSVQQMIDGYVRVSPREGSEEDVWNKVANVAAERVFTILEPLLTSEAVQSHIKLKAKCSYGMGKALVLMTQQSRLGSPSPWTQPNEEEGNGDMQVADIEGEDGGGREGGDDEVSLEEPEKVADSESVQRMTRASQSLREALDLALQCGDYDVAAKVALTFADSTGIQDNKATSLYLSVYQSCEASQNLHQLLQKVVSDPSETKLGALLHQHTKLANSSTPPPPPLLDNVSQQLNTYSCWQRLTVSDGYSDLLKYFPSHFRFILLQHSPDKSLLYSAYLVPPQPRQVTKKGQPPPIAASELTVVARVDVSKREREKLMRLVESCHKLQAQQLLRKIPPSGCVMNQEFNNIINSVNDYLSPALRPISNALHQEKSDEGLTVALLTDFDLLRLPLEGLSLLKSECIKAVARDLSLQMHYHRIKKYLMQEEAATKKDKFLAQPPFIQANLSNFKYILDPRCELFEKDEDIPSDKVASQLNSFPKKTIKWTGHKGTTAEDAMSSNQWYPIINQCSGLIYLGSERLLAHFPATQIVPLTLQDCSIAIVMDRMQTLKSSLVQSKLDMLKSEEEIEFERGVETAALLSLVGIDCVISRQWHSQVLDCTNDTCHLLNGLLSEGICVANLKWREIEQLRAIDSDSQELPSQSNHNNDHSAQFNTIVYGLPHLSLLPPS